jgi:hypothetical protein
MLVDHFRHLEQEEGVPFGPELVLRGAEERLVPILMTALTTALALIPLVVGGNLPGHEIEYPMALVILGGLATSTVLNLLVFRRSTFDSDGRPYDPGRQYADSANPPRALKIPESDQPVCLGDWPQ